MELTVQLEDNVDLTFLKKMLAQIKGVKSVVVSKTNNSYSWQEIEGFENFGKVMEQSENEFRNGNSEEITDDLLDEIFDKK